MENDVTYNLIKALGYIPTGFSDIWKNRFGDKIKVNIIMKGQDSGRIFFEPINNNQ